LTVANVLISSRAYDGTTAAGALALGALSGFVGSETVTATGVAGALSSKDVGSYSTTVSYTLANGSNGGLASNYSLASSTGVSAAITAKALSIGAPTISSKTYDGTTAAGTLTLGTLSGLVTGEAVTVSGAAGALSSKDVGSYSTTVSYTLGNGINGLASNYTLASNTGVNAAITTKALSIGAPTIASKTYDGTTAAGTLTLGSLSGLVSGETVTVSGAAGALSSKDVGSYSTTVSYTLGNGINGLATNYTLASNTGVSAAITAKGLSITGLTVNNKEYDGTTAATTTWNTTGLQVSEPVGSGSASDGKPYTGDNVYLRAGTGIASFADKNVGANKNITVTGLSLDGLQASNYSVTNALATANITPKALSIGAPTIASKTYDGTTAAGTLTLGTLSGLVSGETVTATGTAAALSSKNVGSYSTTVGYALADGTNGGLASNYTLADSTGVSAAITAKALSIGAPTIAGKTYDGTTAAGTLTLGTLSGFVGSETVTTTGAAGALSSKNVGSYNTTVNYTLADGTNGGLASNYTLADSTGVSAAITTKALSIGAPTIASKTYDGTTAAGTLTLGTLSGFVGSETVTTTGTAAALSSKNVGSYSTTVGYALADGTNGGLASNYTLADSTGVSAAITTKALSIGAPTIASKTYDGTTAAGMLTLGTLSGFVGSETVTATGAAGALASKDVGSYNTTVGYTLANGTNGGLASNYTLADSAGVSAAITAKALSIGAPTIASKTYDGTTAAGTLTLGTLSGFVGSETVTTTGTAAALSSKNVGSYSTTVGYALADGTNGGLASNYTLADSTGVSAAITAKALTVTGSNTSRTYNGTSQSNSSSFTTSGLKGSDAVSAVSGQASGTNVGTYTDALSGATGTGLGNYTISYVNGSLQITPAALTVTGSSTSSVYSGASQSNSASFTTSGLKGSDAVSAVSGQASGTNVGTYTDALSGATGTGLGNYTISYVNGSLQITPAALTAANNTVAPLPAVVVPVLLPNGLPVTANPPPAALTGLEFVVTATPPSTGSQIGNQGTPTAVAGTAAEGIILTTGNQPGPARNASGSTADRVVLNVPEPVELAVNREIRSEQASGAKTSESRPGQKLDPGSSSSTTVYRKLEVQVIDTGINTSVPMPPSTSGLPLPAGEIDN
jgi:hypothetical protein